MQRRSFLMLTGLPLLSALSAHAQQAQVLQFSTLIGTDPATLIAAAILEEAYRKLNIHIEVLELPGERSLQSADFGVTDGELYRKAGMEKQYPHLLMIPVALMNYEIVVFTHKLTFPVTGWESLRPYTVGFVKSIKIIEENTQGMKIEVANSLRNAFLKMMQGRSDVVVSNRLSGLSMIKELGLSDITVLAPPLAAFPVYHYINKKHAALAAELTGILMKMQNDKSIQEIHKKVRRELDLE
jgi:polar amino acid transport system substrate-binding protein